MTEHDSIVIYMADSVRRDFFPEFDDGVTVDAVAQGPNTPRSYPAILSGMGPDKHGVGWFGEQCQMPTVLDLDQNGYDTALFDHPDDAVFGLFGNPPRKDYDEMEPPFVWTKRETVTHIPYNETWEDYPLDATGQKGERVYPDHRGRDYIDMIRAAGAVQMGELDEDEIEEKGADYFQNRDELTPWQKQKIREGFDYKEDYRKAIARSKQQFLDIVEYLKENDMLEDTLCVYCSDHGDAWPDDNAPGLIHNVVCPEVINVKVHFHNADRSDVEPFLNRNGEMMLKDIVRVWCDGWDEVRHDLDVREADETDEEAVKNRLEDLGYD